MELVAAETLANQLMATHGLTAAGWIFDFDNAKKRLGNCSFTKKRITISKHMVSAATTDEVEQALLHEIAHALAGHPAGHGPIWQAKARSIGYRGGRTAVNPYMVQQRHPAALALTTKGAGVGTGLRPGTRVRMLGNTKGTIEQFARSRYHVLGDDGRRYGCDPRGLTLLDEPARSMEQTPDFRVGDHVQVTRGKFAGRPTRITKVLRATLELEAFPGYRFPRNLITHAATAAA